MEKKNFFSRKIVITILALVILGIGIFLVSNSFTSSSDGKINVTLVDMKGSIIKEKEIPFNKGDKLVTLLEENFDHVVVDNGMLLSIDTFTTPADFSEFIAIYVDDQMSEVGILDIEFIDGTNISFIMTELNY